MAIFREKFHALGRFSIAVEVFSFDALDAGPLMVLLNGHAESEEKNRVGRPFFAPHLHMHVMS